MLKLTRALIRPALTPHRSMMTAVSPTRLVFHSGPVSLSAEAQPKRSSSSGPRIEPYRPTLLPTRRDCTVTRTRNHRDVAVSFSNSHILHAQLERRPEGPAINLRVQDLDPGALIEPEMAQRAVWNAVFPFFEKGADGPNEVAVELVLPSNVLHDALIALGAKHTPPSYVLSRAAIFSHFNWASATTPSSPASEVRATTSVNDGHRTSTVANGTPVEHPVRPLRPAEGEVIYSRAVPHLGEHFELAVISRGDVPTLHKWMNDPRVNANWNEGGDMHKITKFVTDGLANPASMPVIGSYITSSGEKQQAVYSEIYFVKEDRLGPLLPSDWAAGDYDRGIHQLVGSDQHRGPHRVRAWLPSLVHYCFLNEPRTERVYCEPNEKNEKMVNYLEQVGFVRRGTVVFPHKTSALMIIERNKFYELCPL